MQRPGQEFEEFVVATCMSLCPSLSLTANAKVIGKRSGTRRQIDLSIRDGDWLTIVEAKGHRKPLEIGYVEKLLSFAADVQANRSALVAKTGFTLGAQKRAAPEAMDLYTVIDPTGEHRWQQDFSAESLCLVTLIKDVKLNFLDSSEYLASNSVSNPFCLKLYDLQYNALGPIHDLLFALPDLPILDTILFNFPLVLEPVLIEDSHAFGGFREINPTATMSLKTESWLGRTRLLQGRGLFNELSKKATLPMSSAIFESIDIRELRTNWDRIIDLTDDLLDSKMVYRYTGIPTQWCPGHHNCTPAAR